MPAAIPAVLAAAGASSVVVAAATVAAAVASYAIQSAQTKRAQRSAAEQAEAAYTASVTNRTAVIRSAIAPRNMVFGRDRTSGPLACWFTWGDIKQWHTFAVVLAGHECDGIEKIYFNGEPIALSGSPGDQDRQVTTPKYARTTNILASETLTFNAFGVATASHAPINYDTYAMLVPDDPMPTPVWERATLISGTSITVPAAAGRTVPVTYTYTQLTPLFYITEYLGAPGQQASIHLIEAAAAAGTPSAWDSNRRGTGVTYIVVKMVADYDVLGQIGVPNISAVVRGVKAYDPRIGGVPLWTENPALQARWFLVESIYSPLTLPGEVNTDTLIASANVCEEAVQFGPGDIGARYTGDGQLSSDGSPLDNLNRILDAMDGDAVWVCGAWQIVAGYHRVSSKTLDESALNAADIKINPYLPKDKLFNLVNGTYVNPQAGYVRTSYPAVSVDAYVTQDGGESLPVSMDFDLVNEPRRCQMIAWQRLTRARQQLTTQFGTNLRGYDIWPTETVTLVQKEFYGSTPKEFTVQRREFSNGQLSYVMQETSAAVWNWNYANASQPVDLPNTSLPNPFDLPSPAIILLRSGDSELLIGDDGSITSRIYFEVSPTDNYYVLNGGLLETRYAIAGTEDWQAGPVPPGSHTFDWLSPVEDGQTYAIQARYRNSANRVSSWSPAVLHVVIGKREPPPNVQTFTVLSNSFSWSPVVANDLAGYQLRFNYGQNTAWGTATPLHTGIVTESPWTPDNYPSGQVTVLIKAQDTTGNQSLLAAAILTNLGDPIVANLIETYDDKAAGFPGIKVGGSVVSGDLLADDSGNLFWGADNGNFWGQDAAKFWPTATYVQMVYTLSYDVTPNGVGSRLTLLTDIEAESYTIEYRFGTQGLFWKQSDNFFWGADADLFWAQPTEWQTWPGSIENIESGQIQIRITTQAGIVQGAIRELTLQFDVEDETEFLNDISIAPGGTRLPLTKSYRSIKNILMTSQAIGGNTPIPIILDKDVDLGPLVATYTSLTGGTSVTGKIDAQIQGVKGN